jgi:hypothetical protein
METKVALFIESVDDLIVSINSDGLPTEISVITLCSQAESPWWLENDPNDVADLCTTTEKTIVEMTLRRADTSTYDLASEYFVGPHPTHPPTR